MTETPDEQAGSPAVEQGETASPAVEQGEEQASPATEVGEGSDENEQ
jgi:hypothetical protein